MHRTKVNKLYKKIRNAKLGECYLSATEQKSFKKLLPGYNTSNAQEVAIRLMDIDIKNGTVSVNGKDAKVVLDSMPKNIKSFKTSHRFVTKILQLADDYDRILLLKLLKHRSPDRPQSFPDLLMSNKYWQKTYKELMKYIL